MSKKLTPDRLAEIRDSKYGMDFFPQSKTDLSDLLAHIDAQAEEIERLSKEFFEQRLEGARDFDSWLATQDPAHVNNGAWIRAWIEAIESKAQQ